jgi:hypothetical protein
MPLESVTIVGGERLRAHPKDRCAGDERCAIHKPTQHSMSEFPQHFREDTGIMERICPHGVGHPDPDHLWFITKMFGEKLAHTQSIHGCDGCCADISKTTTPTLPTLVEAQWSHITPENDPFPEKE